MYLPIFPRFYNNALSEIIGKKLIENMIVEGKTGIKRLYLNGNNSVEILQHV